MQKITTVQIFWEGRKIWKKIPLFLNYSILPNQGCCFFSNFFGLLRISELYEKVPKMITFKASFWGAYKVRPLRVVLLWGDCMFILASPWTLTLGLMKESLHEQKLINQSCDINSNLMPLGSCQNILKAWNTARRAPE